ncbi:hypothetical protein ACHAWT_006634 [Skeletonema menzelii]
MSSSMFHYHSYFKDSISVQKRRRSTNDCEEHESNPHLQDFLVPHHTGDVKSQEIDRSTKRKPTLPRPCVSILHNADCPSRHSCEITESKRHISFHEVTVREYDMVLGDHPNCSYGPPISLGWHYLEYEPMNVNEYEFHHSRRRNLRQLCLNYYRRQEILLKDHTEDELRRATKEKDRVMFTRKMTKAIFKYGMVGEYIDRALHKIAKRVNSKKNNEAGKKKEVGGNTWRSEDELDWSRSKFTKESSILRK